MSLVQATRTTYSDLVAQPGLTLAMYDYPKERYGNDRKLRAAFRNMAGLHPQFTLLYVDMTQIGEIVGRTPYCPTFRMFQSGQEVGEWFTNGKRSDRAMVCWAEGYLPEAQRTELDRVEYPLKHGISLVAGYIRDPIDIHSVCDFLARAMQWFKKLGGSYKGPYFRDVRSRGKRASCSLSLYRPDDAAGGLLTAAQWLEAVNGAFSSAYLLEGMADQSEAMRANAHSDLSGWVLVVLDTLDKPYGHLKALRMVFEQSERWDAEKV